MNRSRFVSLVAIGLIIGGLSRSVLADSPTVSPSPAVNGGGGLFGAPREAPLVLSDVKFSGTPLSDVLHLMREKDPRFVFTLVVDPAARPDPPAISITARSIEYAELLMLVAKTYPEVVVTPVSGNVYAIRIQPPNAPAPTSVKVYRIPEFYSASGIDLTTSDPKLQKLLDKPIPELKFEQAKFTDVIDFLRDVTGANIVVNWPELEASEVDANSPVTLRLRDAKFSTVLRELLSGRGAGVACVAEDGVITIGGPRLLTGSRSSAAILSLIEAAVAQVPGASPTLKFHEATRTLIVKGTQEQQEAVRQAVTAVTAEPAKSAATQQSH